MTQEEIRQQLPAHLRQFVAVQDYQQRYTEQDQAVWRLIMKLLGHQLRDSAHAVYFDGLKRTGISVEKIPTIDEMNLCLARLGWRAIVVDGFIPPQAFMELQSLKVLAIALDMRSPQHILYTPAPDIIHEAAGHAPIIADVEYSVYLERFGEVGMRALYNRYDIELYEAVRKLSIVKERFPVESKEVQEAEQTLLELTDNPGEPSELALLTRLHWWTVEYGLVGTPEDYKIFGAGLLSSLLEAESCLDDDKVHKLPLTIDAIKQSYDITNQQPQLYVTKSCRHLSQILDEFAATMCYSTGGTQSLEAAAKSEVVTTARLSSGLTISGKFKQPHKNVIDEVIYFGTEGPTQISLNRKELEGHGINHHAQGFGSPVGRICNLLKPLEQATEYELQEAGIRRDEFVNLEFLSGITVSGHLSSISKHHATILLMTFKDCTVLSPTGEVLFDPAWGIYDMAVGDTITSVYSGSGDPFQFDVYPTASAVQNPTTVHHDDAFSLLAKNPSLDTIEYLLASDADNWLLHIEMLNHLNSKTEAYKSIQDRLNQFASHEPLVKSYLEASRSTALV